MTVLPASMEMVAADKKAREQPTAVTRPGGGRLYDDLRRRPSAAPLAAYQMPGAWAATMESAGSGHSSKPYAVFQLRSGRTDRMRMLRRRALKSSTTSSI